MKRFSFCAILSLLPSLLAPAALAQGFSYDGNRWYEIEVSIFSNQGPSRSDERLRPEQTDLSYQQPLLQLEPAVNSFLIDFETPASEMEPLPGLQQPAPSLPDTGQTIVIGPAPKPPEGDFRLTDFSRDPFIALGTEEARFDEYNEDLRRSPDHRLLFHAVWRQPVLNRVQSSAIFVKGGDQYGRHHELEGSMRFSYNVNRVDIEARLWLAAFSAFPGAETGATAWQLPEPPFQADDATLTMDLPVTRLAYMEQLRQMVSNQLYYLDHPELGILVQIRPYELPQPLGFAFE